MMVTEEMEPWLHLSEHLVDLRLPRVGSSAARKRTKRLRRFVGQQDVDRAQPLASLDLFAHEVSSFVRQLGRFRAPLLRMREIAGGRLVPCGREGATEPRNPDGDSRAEALRYDRCAVGDVMQVRRQISGRNGVEVVVVPVDPVDRGAERGIFKIRSTRLVGDVADAQPEGNLGMPRDDTARRVERAVYVA
jgi:hypothetical protein